MLEFLTDFALPLVVGIGLGALFFGGLWLTMRALPKSQNPALLMICSYFGRLGAAAVTLLLLARSGNWKPLLACLAGFLMVKLVMVFWLSPRRQRLDNGLVDGVSIIREVEDGNQP